MRNSFFHGVGGVLSADIAVPEHQSELSFYSRILTSGKTPLWRDDLMNNFGTPVIGLGARTPEYEFLPLQWMPHFQVADVASSVANAIEMGGKELMYSKTNEGQSQWAVLADPDGAAFGIIPVVPAESDNSQQREHFGCISWLSLMVPDALSSRNFYQKVIGWKAKSVETEESGEQVPKFEMYNDNGSAAAEILQIQSEQNSIPPVWLIHLPVDDLVESLQLVDEYGGEVIRENAGENYAIVRDPIGVYLALRSG